MNHADYAMNAAHESVKHSTNALRQMLDGASRITTLKLVVTTIAHASWAAVHLSIAWVLSEDLPIACESCLSAKLPLTDGRCPACGTLA